MRKLIYIILLFCNVLVFAQKEANPFSEAEKQNNAFIESAHSDQQAGDESVVSRGPGNPGDPVPIDGYLPILLFAAGGMIVYFSRKKSKLNMKF